MNLHAIISNHDSIKFEYCPTCGHLMRTTTESERNKMIEKIIETVTRYFDIEFKQLCKKNRKREIVMTRQLIYYFIRDRIKNAISLTTMGKLFGGLNQDHTTVIHSIHTINDLIFSDSEVKREIEEINLKLDDILLNN